MPDNFSVNLHSLLFLAVSGVIAIAASRITRAHPAYFFIAAGAIAAIFSPYSLTNMGLVAELSNLGALFAVFLAALKIRFNPGQAFSLKGTWQGPLGQAVLALLLGLALYSFAGFEAKAAATIGALVVMNASGFFSEVGALAVVAALGAMTTETRVSGANILQITVGALLILLILVSLLPQTLRYLMRRFGEESYALYYLLLTLVIAVIAITHRVGLEGAIGAYAAGFVLARFVAEDSKLLDRLRFTGESIIIPAFFLAMGFSLSASLTPKPGTVFLALGIVTVLVAANYFQNRLIHQRLSKSPLFLVLVYVAYARGILPIAAVQLLLFVAGISEVAAVILAKIRGEKPEILRIEPGLRILLPVSNPESILPLVTLASHLGNAAAPEKIYPLNVVPDDDRAGERIRSLEETYSKTIDPSIARAQGLELTARIHNDRTHAVYQAARELLAERILLGLGQVSTLAKPQSYSFLESLVARATDRTIIAAHTEADFTATTSLSVIVASAELAKKPDSWISLVTNLARRLRAETTIHADTAAIGYLEELCGNLSFHLRAGHVHAGLDLVAFAPDRDALVIAIIDRPSQGVQSRVHARMPEMMLRAFSERNFLLIYPPATAEPGQTQQAGRWQRVKKFFGFY